MRAGTLRNVIDIMKPEYAPDAMGQCVVSWTKHATIWADVVPITAREYLTAGAINTAVTVKVIARYQPGLRPGWRLHHGDRVYDVMAVLNYNMRSDDMVFMCRELPASAS